INIFLANKGIIPKEVNSGSGTGLKMRLIGQAYGLRAYYYFQLYKMWGGVPIIDHVIDPSGKENIDLPRSSVDSVVSFILDDIAKAKALLPPRMDGSKVGRINGAAIRALKSRLLLYYASPLSNPNNEKARWTAAAKAAQDALSYALANGY